jgi:translation elongation factor EF-Tu-like GTPase
MKGNPWCQLEAIWQADGMDQGIDFAVERLFDVPRRGTVVVGTVMSGAIGVGDVVEFRSTITKVAAIERGRLLLPRATSGDRVGILLEGWRANL